MDLLIRHLSHDLFSGIEPRQVFTPKNLDIGLFKQITLNDVVRQHASARPGAVAIAFKEREITYFDLHRLATQAALEFREHGLRKGDRLAYIGKNSADFAILIAAAARSGVIIAPLNWRLAPAELEAILEDMDPRAIFLTPDFPELTKNLGEHFRLIERVCGARDSEDDIPAHWQAAHDQSLDLPCSEDDVILQLYTSGTTGAPKGVMLTHKCLTWQRRLSPVSSSDHSKPDEILILTMALGHIGGIQILARGLFHGCKTVILPEYETDSVARLISEHRVSRLVIAPTMLRMLLDHADREKLDISSLRYIQYGASPMPMDLMSRAIAELSVDFIQVYGMTEMGGAVTALTPEDHVVGGSRISSVGRALPGVEIRIAGPQGATLPPRQVGQIEIRGGAVMRGYWRRPDETAMTLTGDGWLRTGDAGYLDEEGYLTLCDRIKDMICTGGENVYPAEVEQAILRNPLVSDAVVIGVPDERWGETVKAIVVAKAGADISPERIIAEARRHIAGFKLPKSVEFVTSIPRDALGKVRRKDIREPYWAGHVKRIA
jgi:acyl-CoA synthetase (AMP-forming)/AMP-acid ligase II